ncbi:winged helix-turn-helix transcriptional regulator [Acidimangrovimonas sediminis]|uniref:winged helix-turn-helix transcriptional regulator n=1 Tax=Acidimangrovimonas sediminis TaxID=2056283 RepID=UPI000C8013A6|nr:helix-turn-helix domain-containing protein [Acidimangrovimonas sediminis]
MERRDKSVPAFDPLLGRVAAQTETTSDRFRAKFSDHYRWCFCELCWRPTEFSATLEAPTVIKRHARGNATIVPLTDAMRRAAMRRTDEVVSRYERACKGELGRYEAARIWARYCDAQEMRGDRSVEGFREHVERRMLITEWARHGELVWSSRSPRAMEGARPSRLYCETHNPRRSEDARRAYQRDRRFVAEFEAKIDVVWREAIRQALLPTWDIEAHAEVRREAYRQVQVAKSPTAMIDKLLAEEGPMTQAEIARRLGTSRQAVSAALRRRARKAVSPEK